MNDDRSNEEPGAGRIVLMAVLLAGLVTLLSVVLDAPSDDGPAVQPLMSAQAAVLASPVDGPATRPVATPKPDEPWGADESSRGMRPDASH